MILAVAIGGALGALARYGASAGLARIVRDTAWAGYPLGTLAVNVLGTFLLGVLVFHERLPLPPAVRLGVGTGFLGAMTTFSTFELDLFLLQDQRGAFAALAYLAANVVLGFAALVAGRSLATG